MLHRCLAALVGGIICSLAFEPLAWAWLAPVAVACFVLAVRGLGWRRAAVVGLVFGAAFFYPLIWWMRVVGVDAWIGLAGIQTAFFAVLGPVTAAVQRWRGGPVWVAVAWLAGEVAHSSWPFGGFPWGRLGFAAIDTPLAEAMPYVGTNGVGLLTALLGATLAHALVGLAAHRRRARTLAPLAVVLAVATVPVLLPWTSVRGGDDRVETARVAAVQGNVPGRGDDVLLDHRQLTANHVEATVELAERVAAGDVAAPDFVVWPENSTAVDPFRDAGIRGGIETAVEAIDRPVLVGALVDADDPEQVLNQGIVWGPVTGAADRYTKWHPVPFGEFIPFRNGLLTAWVGRLELVARDMVAGTRRTPLEVAGVSVADAICFDVGYDDGIYTQVRNGAELLTVQTSNAMFVFTDQIDQQFAMSRLRALETGRYVVVAAVNGVSGIIAPDGSVVASAAPRTSEVLLAEVELRTATTPAVHLAPWLGRAALAGTGVMVAMSLVPYARRRRRPAEREAAPRREPVEPVLHS